MTDHELCEVRHEELGQILVPKVDERIKIALVTGEHTAQLQDEPRRKQAAKRRSRSESVGHPRKTRSGNARQLREVDMPPQVAAEHLIAAIATQDDLDVLARKLGYEIERKSGRNSERFVGVPRNLRQ